MDMVVFTVMRLVVGVTAGVIVGMGSGVITGAAVGMIVGAGLGVIVRISCAGTVARFPRDHPAPRSAAARSGYVERGPASSAGVDDVAPSTTTPRDRIGRGAFS